MRRGLALPLALFTLALLGGLVVASAFVARRAVAEQGVSRRASELEPLADRAIVEAIAQWDSAARTDQPVGTVVTSPPARTGTVETQTWITKLGERRYAIFADARALQRPALRRRIGLIVHLVDGAPIPIPERPYSEFP